MTQPPAREPRQPPVLTLVPGTGGSMTGPDCRCGHPDLAHRHHRRGDDCALCRCARFRAGPRG